MQRIEPSLDIENTPTNVEAKLMSEDHSKSQTSPIGTLCNNNSNDYLKAKHSLSSKQNSTVSTGTDQNPNLIFPDEQYRRSLSEDPNFGQLQDNRFTSTDSVTMSNSMANNLDWSASTNSISNTLQPSGSSKFGGSSFSITRHKKVDLSAYDEARSQIMSERKEEDDEMNLSEKSSDKFESYNVLEKTAAIAFEQVKNNTD